MPIQTDLNVSPYYDDYNANNSYHRILFKPSVAVQARELNQTQSILQDQIEKFGDSIYYHGSVVKAGEHFFDQSLYTVKLANTYPNNPVIKVQAVFFKLCSFTKKRKYSACVFLCYTPLMALFSNQQHWRWDDEHTISALAGNA